MTTNTTMCAQCHTTIPKTLGLSALRCERPVSTGEEVQYCCDKRCHYREAVEYHRHINLALPKSFALAMIAACTDDQLEKFNFNDRNSFRLTISLRKEDLKFALGILANSNA
jgi:hypothetical protein